MHSPFDSCFSICLDCARCQPRLSHPENPLKLLLVNGNRTQAVTDIVLAEARRVAAPGTALLAVTAAFGMDIVFSHAGDVIAAHAVLDVLAKHHHGCDAAILAISFDSGLAAARELLPIPVLGITESALHAAGQIGGRIGIITFGEGSRALYQEVFTRYGVLPSPPSLPIVAGVRVIDIASTADYLSAGKMDARIVAEANALAGEGAKAVVICGAAMAGVARRLQPAVSVPLVDGVASAVMRAEALVGAGFRPSAPLRPAQTAGLSAELAALFQRV